MSKFVIRKLGLWLCLGLGALGLAGCRDAASSPTSGSVATATAAPPQPVVTVRSTAVATLSNPWAMVFLPDGRMLVTERPPWENPSGERYKNPVAPGKIRLVTQAGVVSEPIDGLPLNAGILDIQLSPKFSSNQLIYFSLIEPDPNAPRVGRDKDDLEITPAGLAVATGRLTIDASGRARLDQVAVIWRQMPKIVSFPGSANMAPA